MTLISEPVGGAELISAYTAALTGHYHDLRHKSKALLGLRRRLRQRDLGPATAVDSRDLVPRPRIYEHAAQRQLRSGVRRFAMARLAGTNGTRGRNSRRIAAMIRGDCRPRRCRISPDARRRGGDCALFLRPWIWRILGSTARRFSTPTKRRYGREI